MITEKKAARHLLQVFSAATHLFLVSIRENPFFPFALQCEWQLLSIKVIDWWLPYLIRYNRTLDCSLPEGRSRLQDVFLHSAYNSRARLAPGNNEVLSKDTIAILQYDWCANKL